MKHERLVCDCCGSLTISYLGVNAGAVIVCTECGSVLRKVDERDDDEGLPLSDLFSVSR